jgi:hypothetical protein
MTYYKILQSPANSKEKSIFADWLKLSAPKAKILRKELSAPNRPGTFVGRCRHIPGLGNIDIDQAVVSAIANMIAVKITIVRMTPVRVDQPRRDSFGAFRVGRV